MGSIRQVISPLMTYRYCHLEEVADVVGMHQRTMQRRLADVEQEYLEVLARVRFETAVRLMDDPHTSLTDIAFELGYTDPTNFTRAFRHWTGVSPSRFRNLRRRCAG